MGLKSKILMNCANATAMVEKKRDGKATFTERLGVWIHLRFCSLCRLFFEQCAVLDKSFRAFAGHIDIEKQAYPLDPAKKQSLSKAFDEELKK